jgi:hypothetical protein
MERAGLIRLAFLAVLGIPALIASAPMSSPSPSPAPSASPSAQVLLPRATVVIVKTLHGINSYGQEAGAKLTYEVVQDVLARSRALADSIRCKLTTSAEAGSA